MINKIRLFKDFDKLESMLFTFDAHKELTYSKYFQKYYGFNVVSDDDYNLYFFEHLKGKSLRSLVSGVG